MPKICSKCKVKFTRKNQRYCLKCHAENMRLFRKTHKMTLIQKFKDGCRSYAGVYKRRGKIIKSPCKCGNPNSEMHHTDYNQPLRVEWLCRTCHLSLHAKRLDNKKGCQPTPTASR